MIFVHGWTCDSSSWTSQVPALRQEYRVVTVDLPGHGKSASPKDGKLSMGLFARAVEAVRAEANADRVVLVGHSMGAPVIREYARLYPQHVAGLVAVDGPLDMRGFPPPNFQQPPPMVGPEGVKAREKNDRGMFTPQTPPPLQEHILKMMLGTPKPQRTARWPPSSIRRCRRPTSSRRRRSRSRPAPRRCPTSKVMKEVLPNSEATQVAGTGHFVMMEKPEEFNRDPDRLSTRSLGACVRA